MKMRKLLRPQLYSEVQRKLDEGVPLSRIMRQLHIQMSHPACSKLMRNYKEGIDTDNPEMAQVIHESLFPVWLNPLGERVQEQPFAYRYIGYFPYGVWTND